jgi:signal peptidase I
MVFGRNPRRTLIRLLLLVVTSVVLFKYILLPIQVTGLSMAPTYLNGKVGLVNQMAYKWNKPKRGDVVAVRVPGEKDLLLKRIVALPGEKVALWNGRVFVNRQELEEPYVKTQGPFRMRELELEEDHYFVIGDNRNVSVYFQVPAWNIVGKVVF